MLDYLEVQGFSVLLVGILRPKLAFYGQVNIVMVMSHQSVNLLIPFLGRLTCSRKSSKWLPVFVHILSPVTDKCPS